MFKSSVVSNNETMFRNSAFLWAYITVFLIGSVAPQDVPTFNERDSQHQGHHRQKHFASVNETERVGGVNVRKGFHNKFIETLPEGIELDDVDIVLSRLKNISMMTSSKISEILAIQEEEFKVNDVYKEGWIRAVNIFNDSSKREKIFNNTTPGSVVQKVPAEYHIAIIAYTLGYPTVYYNFNNDTRQVCSGADLSNYHWKSYFKLLQLAVETLGSQVDHWKDSQRFTYRGATPKFNLKVGQILAFQHFISTSASLKLAEQFAGASLFEFEGIYDATAMAIWDHSVFEGEQEVLFLPMQTFKVDSIHVGTHYTRYVLVKNSSSMRTYCIQTQLLALILFVVSFGHLG